MTMTLAAGLCAAASVAPGSVAAAGEPGLLPGGSRAILTDHPGCHRTSSQQARAVTVASPQRSYRWLLWDERVVIARS